MFRYTIIAAAILVQVLGSPRIRFPNERIVNGTDVSSGEYPFMASLQHSLNHACGGSIINENYILTAAHCVDRMTPEELSILVGTTSLMYYGRRYYVDSYKIHEGYSVIDHYIHDIAVVKVNTPIEFTDLIQPVTLPVQMEETPGGTDTTVIGWGVPYYGGSVMITLQKVDLKIYSDEECQSIYLNPPYDSNICAGVPEGGKGHCNGDSGGPLLANGHQVGIVSWSIIPCTTAPYPGVCTEVSYYVDWIKENTA